MRGGLLFLCIGVASLGLAGHGFATAGVIALERFSPGLILREEQPFWHAVTISAYALMGLLMTGISVLFFWSRRKEKNAEERFFRQRKFLR